jgi:hypothetical protein
MTHTALTWLLAVAIAVGALVLVAVAGVVGRDREDAGGGE